MIMIRCVILVLAIIVSLNTAVFGCDTNLFALFTRENLQDTFSRTIFQLASETRDFGTKVLGTFPKNAEPFLKQLMKTWVTFDNQFSQFPPVWAKSDQHWSDKFKNLANLIGEMQKEYQAGRFSEAHDRTLAFSRQLMQLFEGMPNPPDKVALIKITQGFQLMWNGIDNKNPSIFEEGIRELSSSAATLQEHLSTSTKILGQDFIEQIKIIQHKYSESPGTLTPILRLYTSTAESTFSALTAKIREQNEQKK